MININESEAFLSSVVTEIKNAFEVKLVGIYDYKLDFIDRICDIPVNAFIRFTSNYQNELYICIEIFVNHKKFRVCNCGDKYILFYHKLMGLMLPALCNKNIFTIFEITMNDLISLSYDNINGCLTPKKNNINDKLVFFKPLLNTPTIHTPYEDCCVCYEKTQTILKCNHKICLLCIEKIHKPKCCPICRIKITTLNIPDNLNFGYIRNPLGNHCYLNDIIILSDNEEEGMEEYIDENDGRNDPANYPPEIEEFIEQLRID